MKNAIIQVIGTENERYFNLVWDVPTTYVGVGVTNYPTLVEEKRRNVDEMGMFTDGNVEGFYHGSASNSHYYLADGETPYEAFRKIADERNDEITFSEEMFSFDGIRGYEEIA